MKSPNVSSGRTETSDRQFRLGQASAPTSSAPNLCRVFQIESYLEPAAQVPERHTTISDVVAKWSKDEGRRAAIEQARRWAAAELHEERGETLRACRLRKGWSQVQLARAIGTSQPHIARIERGTENLAIETCRRLAVALGLDMNALDRALRLQQAGASERTSR